ncbi:VWFA domain-containing protein [Chloropicon primus]|uniref:VWFA domain-containing protein n=1 Tax=Chloropicon primus TaxID=1764295 RepID=A0A5B8MTM0_9CHLO|nr:hypothetical protein A3770_08p52800 [Chloropicon primus]UPR01986.1 VWFA domain-containing protein [Chloropicon primus]|mmetsp:Transcript_2446/g.6755  ORF Transcript_2446/g.6755 Transcript_2446/m.6755 type:complete len:429 (+) Transcript_2446:674-1960(+)|eukprot:QDZ22762.1 hypothetical protein A3770_08p52800 [Chloropicon primus]
MLLREVLRGARRLTASLFPNQEQGVVGPGEGQEAGQPEEVGSARVVTRSRSRRSRQKRSGTVPLPLPLTDGIPAKVRRSRRGVRVGAWKKANSTAVPPMDASGSSSGSSKRSKTRGAPAIAKAAQKKRKRRQRQKEALIIEVLPDELLDGPVLDALGFKDLCTLSLVCRRFDFVVSQRTQRWSSLYIERWGDPGAIGVEASKLAGGWHKFYKAKHLAEKESSPWIQPCDFEVQAMLNHLAGLKCPATQEIMVTFLVDGSGSVTDDDFTTMTSFMSKAVCSLNRQTRGTAKFAIIQFSNEVKVEMQPQPISSEDFDTFAATMSRMNGGTNIALALSKACVTGQEEDAGPGNGGGGARQSQVPHVVLILTDGRIDSYQAKAATAAAEQLFRLQLQLFAFAVGRSVDFDQLTKIVGTESQVMGLRTLHEPW